MDGISQFRAPEVKVVQKQRGPWADVAPDVVKAIVGGVITDKLKEKILAAQQQREFQQKKDLQKSESDLVTERETKLEQMKESAATGKQSGENLIKMLLAGWKVDKDGNWTPPREGTAPEVSGPSGYTPVFEGGKLRFIENKPKVSVQIGGQTIPDVDPNTAATVTGHVAGEKTHGSLTANQVIGETNKYWNEQNSLIDKQYGMTDSRGNMIIDPGQKDKWLSARQKIENQRLSDLYDISGGKKPSWMRTAPTDQEGKAATDKQVQDFIFQFGDGGE